ncbi:glycosyltransferase family 4 protein [Phaeocystidibacter marisrubri]|uniref:Glycosyltransferase family 4 protein n=1 Tax=Phaeocystidibacter marisrubri TaxID=1577780 RepID=A0A6L3ZEC0_9FLAO|nr:glycosyltransferase family 1 protein [Phaeocystidibacter marisrubri]KAB2815976.1 glycosyltransferase family 4 protein [Phaeocystidibacter marisrubri]GGH66688.1 glycosyl transferase family 1 [Phaeocystidibacter marisrubri]
MKIAVNTRWLLKDRLEGMGWFTHSLLKRIVESHPEHEFHFIFDRKADESFRYGENVKFHRVSPPARHPLLWKIWNHTTVPMRLRRIKPDVYFSPDGMAALNWKGPQLLAVHDLNFEHHPEWMPTKVATFYQKYMVQYARMADRIVCVSEHTLEDAARTWGLSKSKLDVVYNAPQAKFHPMTEAKPDLPFDHLNYFVCVGALNPRKNLALAARAFTKYKLQGGRGELVFVGSTMFEDEELNRVLDESPYTNYMHFIGRKHGDELNAILSRSTALLFPSFFEGFGIPIVEAMAAGTPVICSNVSCMPEIAGDAAIQLSPYEVEDWVAAMNQLEEEAERKKWVELGLKRADDFSWDQSAERLWDNILKTANGPTS